MLNFAFLSAIASLLAVTSAVLTNYTLDDSSPAIVYSHTPTLQCNRSTCPEGWTTQLFNRTSTLTQSPGACSFNVDGDNVGVSNNSNPNGNIQLAYRNTSMLDGPPLLLISPAQAEMLIELGYIIYTYGSSTSLLGTIGESNNLSADKKKSEQTHVGAIVAGVVGGVVLIFGTLLGCFSSDDAISRGSFLFGELRLVTETH
ncbi:hypothetical protein C8R43DRAFT_1124326 [Mycena crocata]|nr:hypothetical protein C8R43DRAFT_1124326 [Mycena crocata]